MPAVTPSADATPSVIRDKERTSRRWYLMPYMSTTPQKPVHFKLSLCSQTNPPRTARPRPSLTDGYVSGRARSSIRCDDRTLPYSCQSCRRRRGAAHFARQATSSEACDQLFLDRGRGFQCAKGSTPVRRVAVLQSVVPEADAPLEAGRDGHTPGSRPSAGRPSALGAPPQAPGHAMRASKPTRSRASRPATPRGSASKIPPRGRCQVLTG
jgi:hypothetical protein